MALGASSREPIDALVERVLRQLSQGRAPSSIELERVDFKEEGGRRAGDGSVSPGSTTNEHAASHLLSGLVAADRLKPGRPGTRGRGFFYVPK